MTNANAPIANCKAAGSALLWPDLFYCSFANNFDVAKQDKGRLADWLAYLWRNTLEARGGNISGPAALLEGEKTPEGGVRGERILVI